VIEPLSAQPDFARIGLNGAGEDFDERGFAGPIFTDQGVDFTGKQIQGDAFQGTYSAKGLLYSDCFKKCRVSHLVYLNVVSPVDKLVAGDMM
jgi:hypothetical protein